MAEDITTKQAMADPVTSRTRGYTDERKPAPRNESEEFQNITDDDVREVASNDDLEDGGKKAILREREARREAEKKAKRVDELEAELERFRQDAMSEQERAIEQARKEAAEAARNEVLEETRQDRLRTKVEAAATGKFADPADAHAFVDLSDLDPDDTAAIAEEIDRVLEAKPYLKAGATQATPGDIDQGPRETEEVKQLSRDDLARMTPAEIVAARDAGQLDRLAKTGK